MQKSVKQNKTMNNQSIVMEPKVKMVEDLNLHQVLRTSLINSGGICTFQWKRHPMSSCGCRYIMVTQRWNVTMKMVERKVKMEVPAVS